jgi:hypothetical protein
MFNFLNINKLMELSIKEKSSDVHYDLLSTDDSDILSSLGCIKKDKAADPMLFSGVKEVSNNFGLLKILVYFILLNPFIRLMLKIIDNKVLNSNTLDSLVNKEEKYYIKLISILILLCLNLVIIGFLHDELFRAILFLINNLYMLYFVYEFYSELKQNEKS